MKNPTNSRHVRRVVAKKIKSAFVTPSHYVDSDWVKRFNNIDDSLMALVKTTEAYKSGLSVNLNEDFFQRNLRPRISSD